MIGRKRVGDDVFCTSLTVATDIDASLHDIWRTDLCLSSKRTSCERARRLKVRIGRSSAQALKTTDAEKMSRLQSDSAG